MVDNKKISSVAKIKIVEKSWHGWSKEGAEIPPVERIWEGASGSFMIILEQKNEMVGVWGEKDQEVENMERVDYIQKEGYRIFISEKIPEIVNLSPERSLEPISGKIFPLIYRLPLEKKSLKIGESIDIEPKSFDAGVKFEITLLAVSEEKNSE